jgi:hypothetical protein
VTVTETQTYILKPRRGQSPVTGQEVDVTYNERRRPVGKPTMGFQVVEHASWDHNNVRVTVHNGKTELGTRRPARRAEGGRSPDRYAFVPWTATGIKTVLRKMRPEEAERIAAVDEEIAVLEEQIRERRPARAEIVEEAFRRGHVVRLNELSPREGH